MAIVHGDIGGAEPSTVTFRVDTVTINQNSTVVHREVLVLGDPQSSIAYAVVKAAPPVSTEFGSVVRIASGPSSAADLLMTASQGTNPWTIAGNSTIVFLPAYLSTAVGPPSNSTALNVRIVGGVSSAADFPVSVSGYSTIVSVANTVTVTGAVTTSTIVTIAAMPANSSQVEVRALPANSSQVEVRNTVTIQGNSTVFQGGAPWTVSQSMQSSVMPSSGSSGMIVRQVWDIRASAASTNAMAASTAFSVASSAVGKVYVTAYSITSTVQAPTVLRFMQGSTLIWPVVLAALSSAVTGVNLAGYPFLFCTPAAARPMTLNIASTVAGFRVGVTYFRAP